MASWSQADRDARAVEASTRRMEVLKPGAEFLRPGVQSSLGMLAIGGPLVAECDASDWLRSLRAEGL